MMSDEKTARKQEKDFTPEVVALVPEVTKLVAQEGQLQTALDKIAVLEKQTRNVGPEVFGSYFFFFSSSSLPGICDSRFGTTGGIKPAQSCFPTLNLTIFTSLYTSTRYFPLFDF